MSQIQTVCGKIREEQLGITLPHEHCLVDTSCWGKDTTESSKRELFSQPVSLKNRGDVIYNNFYFKDNLVLTDINNSIEELRDFYGHGGSSLVDMTTDVIGRDPEALKYISRMTNVNIIMGAGRYIENSLSEKDKKKNSKEIALDIINDFDNGVRDTKIKPGVIGEIGIGENLENVFEINGLRGAGIAQSKLGCALNIHPPIWGTYGIEILDILEEEKANIEKVVLSHCDPTLSNWQYHDSLAKRGAYIEYDQFGMEIMTFEGIFLPSDGERINAIKKQIELGNEDKILISGDYCFKVCFRNWGGWGYSHIIKHIVPRMKSAGITEEQINKIIVENPKKLLSF
ncbi:MAG: phosphotriesterase family protein [Candidatus Humimicrobiaceae bacterium]